MKDLNPVALSPSHNTTTTTKALPKLMVWLIFFISTTYVIYTLNLALSSRDCAQIVLSKTATRNSLSPNITDQEDSDSYSERTNIEHLVFGIAASANLWEHRKNYIKTWWKPDEMRGIVWLDTPVKTDVKNLPPVRISGDTSGFSYENKQGHRSAIRISRIVSETLRLPEMVEEEVRWFVMGDDDTVFVVDNLVRVLGKYDHNEMYYIGSVSESHLQNIYFSYGMAFGGGGFAISYPLAVALEEMQDECIERYPGLYGSDDRIQACMAELGVPLTKEVGFHQFDVYGNLFGLLAAHPVAPLVSMHHLDMVDPIFPNTTCVEALQRLTIPMNLDSASLIQQSICYDENNTWTVSISWGYAVQIFRGIMSPREVEMPSRTFLNWYKKADFTSYTFNTRAVTRNPCQKPYIFYLESARLNYFGNETVSVYGKYRAAEPGCKWKIKSPNGIEKVVVYKKPDPHLWDRSPRRNCCRVLESKKDSMKVDVGVCNEGEISGIQFFL